MKLVEWLILYIKHRDAFKQELVSVEEEDPIVFSFKNSVLHGYAWESLQTPPTETAIIATLQRKENVEFLIQHWKEFAKHEQLKIVFVNPERNEKWIINPQLHNKIAGEEFAAGIWSMAESVTFL